MANDQYPMTNDGEQTPKPALVIGFWLFVICTGVS
jgi:hypothetical protein